MVSFVIVGCSSKQEPTDRELLQQTDLKELIRFCKENKNEKDITSTSSHYKHPCI